jgi:hypothetical protein
MTVNLHEQVDLVKSKADLVAFVRALLSELDTNGANWENATLPTYLEALAGWIEDSDGYYRN